MIYYVGGVPYDSNYLEHHGILGMKWGIRRYQNKDGTLTEAGKQRYQKLRDDVTRKTEYANSLKPKGEGKAIGIRKLNDFDGYYHDLASLQVSADKAKLRAERRLKRYESALERDRQKQAEKRSAREKSGKSVKDMTDAELDSAIKDLETKVLRMTKEKKYRQLMSEVSGKKNTSDKKTFNLGQSLVGQILSSSARNIGTQFTTYAMGTALNKIAQNLTEDKELTIVNPKKGQKDK